MSSLSAALVICTLVFHENIAVPAAKTSSIKLENATVAEALTTLERAFAIPVVNQLPGDPRITLHLPNTTFWPALDAIAQAADAKINFYTKDGRLALVPRPVGYANPPVSYSGLFRTSIQRITAAHDFETGVSTYLLRLEIAWEPSLFPLLLETTPRELLVKDDRGRMERCDAVAGAKAYVDRRLASTVDIVLPKIARDVKQLDLLQGRLAVIAPRAMLEFNFGELKTLAAAAPESDLRRQSIDRVVCRLQKVQLNSDRWTIQVAVELPPGGVKLESYQSGIVCNELILQSKDGRRLTPTGYAVDKDTGSSALITYHFTDTANSKRGEPANWTVRYLARSTLVEIPFDFSFKKVLLP